MSAFEFFFSFYGLLLGLSVAELVSGFARVLHERHRVRFGWLTPLLALFVAVDIATFWNQAWVIFRGAPFNPFLLIVGLAIAATFYIAASITFPRLDETGTEQVDLDAHYWSQRRTVFSCIMAANLIVFGVLMMLALGDNGFDRITGTARLWLGTAFFMVCAAVAGFAPRKLAAVALVAILAYSLWSVSTSAIVLLQSGGWEPALSAK